jgi:hypothetical protein
MLHVEFSYFYLFVLLCERTLNVRGFPVREEGQVELSLARRLTDLAQCDTAKVDRTVSTEFAVLLLSTPQRQNDMNIAMTSSQHLYEVRPRKEKSSCRFVKIRAIIL